MLVPAKELDGILLVDKPSDHTSHDVIARLRGKLRMKRIGHAGTLDPMATGLLVVLVGKATAVSQYLISLDKEYTGTIKLGVTTNSQDADGEVLATRPVPALTEADVAAVIKTMLGDQYQMPPMFSAIKIDGVPLYKLARKGEEVVREPRFIRVMSWEITRFALPEIDFRVRCTKGHLRAYARARSRGKTRLRRPSFRVAPHGDRQAYARTCPYARSDQRAHVA